MAEDFSLDAKYTRTEGTILLSGVQALVRLPLDQRRADQRRGLNTAGLISGYRGSPLAGLDLLLQRAGRLLAEQRIRFQPAVNEDLAATMIWGSQIANLFPQPKHDGVIGMWYGKAPGVDRSEDIFKHANFGGVGRLGGVLAVAGDDAMSKSSTLPSRSDTALYEALMPVIAPGNVQEVLDFGRIGFELSRFSGSWVGFKIDTHVADEFGTALVGPDRPAIVQPVFERNGRQFQHTQTHTLGSPGSILLEQEIHEGRLLAAVAFAAANGLNRITVRAPGAWIGIIAAGKLYYELRQALANLGLDNAALERNGVRVLQLGMVFPLDTALVREFARGLEEIVVIEDKRPFIELLVRDALYALPDRPRVIGKRDERDGLFVPAYGGLDANVMAPLLARRLAQRLPREMLAARVAALQALQATNVLPMAAAGANVPRQAYFCSGCPHNRSTVVPDGSMAAGGIGCHGLVHSMGRSTVGLGHMGGEGAQWAGAAPFSGTSHMFQNLGDGTLFHSGSLAIRQAVAAGTHITYKILYNSAVGMTGGQPVDGTMSVPALTRMLEAEGVGRIIVTTDHPDKYAERARFAPGVQVWHRDRLDEAQKELRDSPGVTALIHDQMCAAEMRRQRKRGKLADPATRVVINEAVCEGCGDCGAKSNCLSVQPVDTEFGRKTQIHQSSCNKDYSCVLGDCPAFVTVTPGAVAPATVLHEVNEALPEPAARPAASNVYMMGIGGTGVVTVSQVLGTAALLDGKSVDGMDQTGLSQKGGPVVSHLKISGTPNQGSNLIHAGEADCYLAFDMLTATRAQDLMRASPDRTIAIVSTSQVPTGAMVRSVDAHFPNADLLRGLIDQRSRADHNRYLDAVGLAEQYFGDHLAANLIVLGAAYQAGLLPVSAHAVEQAIALNGQAVKMNTHAFRLGRRWVADDAWARAQHPQRASARTTAPLTPAATALIDATGASGELRRLLEIRVPELTAYQSPRYAAEYTAFVGRVLRAEQAAAPGQTQVSEAVARYLFKLMAYKDEYEVARLYLASGFDSEIADKFGRGAQMRYQLHPPFLRALGVRGKISLGRWFDLGYRALIGLRGLRGTPLDVFGYARVRRVERALISEYRALIERALSDLSPEGHARAVALAELPDGIRGYEEVKLGNVRKFRDAVKALGFA